MRTNPLPRLGEGIYTPKRVRPCGLGNVKIDLLGLYKIVDSMGGYLSVSFRNKWKEVAAIHGLTKAHEALFKEEPVKCEKTKKVEGGCDNAKEENPQGHDGSSNNDTDVDQVADQEDGASTSETDDFVVTLTFKTFDRRIEKHGINGRKSYNRDMLVFERSNDFRNELNMDERKYYDLIIVFGAANQHELIFVYSHGGTRKNFIWKAIISALCSEGKIVLVVASSGNYEPWSGKTQELDLRMHKLQKEAIWVRLTLRHSRWSRVTHDAVMLRVFPIILTGAAKKWVERLPPGTVNTSDLLKHAFIQRYCPLSKTAKQLEEIHNFKQESDETLYQAWESENNARYRVGPLGYYIRMDNQPPSSERKQSLTEMITKCMEESAKKEAEHDEWLRKFQESTKMNKKATMKLSKASILRHFEQHAEEALVHKTMESLKSIKESHEEIVYRSNMLDQREPYEIETVKEPNKEYDIDLSSILRLDAVLDKLDDDWFTKTINDEDDLDGIIDYLELKSHEDFIDINDEAYKERMCKLLGMTYKKTSSILIKKVEVTRYTIGPGESYTKVRILGIEETPRTSTNVVVVKAELMEEMET
nr:retrotransposon Gag protein [Tanacetum cinerariifolium]